MAHKLLIEREAHIERARLPGNMRQRLKRIIDDLANDPRPGYSQNIEPSGLEVPFTVEVRRLRVESWRVVYAVNDAEEWVWVLAIRKRPPCDYQDLPEIVSRLD